MTPNVDLVLKSLAAELEAMAPQVEPAYCSAQLVFMSRMLVAASESWNGAAKNLVDENVEIRALFADIRPLIASDALRARMDEAIAGRDGDLTISVLQDANEDLRRVVSEAHAHIETIDSGEAQQADARIWRHLSASVARRQRSSDMYP